MAIPPRQFGTIRIADPRLAAAIRTSRANGQERYHERKLTRVLNKATRTAASSETTLDWSDHDHEDPASAPVPVPTQRLDHETQRTLARLWHDVEPQLRHMHVHKRGQIHALLIAVLSGDPAAARAWRKITLTLQRSSREEAEHLSARWRAAQRKSERGA